jgi:hypothetical protein
MALFIFVLLPKHEFTLIGKWEWAYDYGSNRDSMKLANDIGLYDEISGSDFFARSAIAEAMQLQGDARNAILVNSLERMQHAWFSMITSHDLKQHYMLEATLNAMLGDNKAALRYAERACGTIAIKQCLHGSYVSNSVFHDKLMALQNYEVATLCLAIGHCDQTQAALRKALALRVFGQSRKAQKRGGG